MSSLEIEDKGGKFVWRFFNMCSSRIGPLQLGVVLVFLQYAHINTLMEGYFNIYKCPTSLCLLPLFNVGLQKILGTHPPPSLSWDDSSNLCDAHQMFGIRHPIMSLQDSVCFMLYVVRALGEFCAVDISTIIKSMRYHGDDADVTMVTPWYTCDTFTCMTVVCGDGAIYRSIFRL